ncbi:4-hydroxyphenylpyruvate dioxygenase [Luedemannella helvata]|uniref:4-hydroxyphenylpyruvate dioxygenase n=1 Tax=Luedemannella helvata TaxID=349315 RepID=A0ABP4VZQ4_9ACTN
MNILGIDHIEMYVGDARQTAYVLCTAFGFRVRGQGGPETGLAGQRSLLLGQGDIRILVTTGLAADHPAAEYVARHGDGVAVIGFGVTDLAEAYATALAGGATGLLPPAEHGQGVRTAMVSGFGDVTHRLVSRAGSADPFLPGAIDMIAPDPDHGDELLQLIDHAAICLPAGELDPTVDFYTDAFGFGEIFSEYIEVGEQGMESRVVQSPSGGVTFTLIQPDTKRSRGQIDDFVAWHGGAGVQHLAFATDDIVRAVRTFADRGVGFSRPPASYYDVLNDRVGEVDVPLAELRDVGVLVDRDHWGQLYQIFTQSLHVRRTFFVELIERHGARTFGSRNIRALYEAKERELAAQRETAAS